MDVRRRSPVSFFRRSDNPGHSFHASGLIPMIEYRASFPAGLRSAVSERGIHVSVNLYCAISHKCYFSPRMQLAQLLHSCMKVVVTKMIEIS
jgi:hypothetical protein